MDIVKTVAEAFFKIIFVSGMIIEALKTTSFRESGYFEAVGNGWSLSLGGRDISSAEPLRIRAKLSEESGRSHFETWVDSFLFRQVSQIAPPAAEAPPARFELFSEADQSARSARLRLFEKNFPAKVIALLKKHALLADSDSMDTLMAMVAQSSRCSTKLNPLRLCLSCFWTTHYLWLMSDSVGSLYFERRIKPLVPGLRTGEEGYENARRELALVQNHKRPVSGTSVTGVLKFR